MANIDNTKPNPTDKSNFGQDREFDWPSSQPEVICVDEGYKAEIEALLSGIRVNSPPSYEPYHKSFVENYFQQYCSSLLNRRRHRGVGRRKIKHQAERSHGV